VKIIGPPSASKATVVKNLVALGPGYERFRDEMFGPLWAVAQEYVIDPVGMVAQSAKETAWGRFTGKARPWQHNTAGIKLHPDAIPAVMAMLGTTDTNHTLVHSQFASWWHGAEVHAQHLRAYAGIPVVTRIYDPRYGAAIATGKTATEWSGLTVWAEGNPLYGVQVEQIMGRLSE
jgi:hypothetical protein